MDKERNNITKIVDGNSLQCVKRSLVPKGQNFLNNPCPIASMVTW